MTRLAKRSVIALSTWSGAVAAARFVQAARLGSSYLRAVIYHGTAHADQAQLEQHFRYYADRFVSVSADGLEAILSGTWSETKPALIISFDDGLRSNYSTAAPLLEAYGLTGWFFLPVGLIEAAGLGDGRDQAELAQQHSIRVGAPDMEGGRVFMSWDEAASLARRHVIGCHTMTHRRLRPGLSPDVLNTEILESKLLLQSRIGGAIDSFCWVGGEETSYSTAAAQCIREAGYRYSFMTRMHSITARSNPQQLHRTALASDWPVQWVDFYLSGAMDVIYAPSRHRVERITAVDTAVR